MSCEAKFDVFGESADLSEKLDSCCHFGSQAAEPVHVEEGLIKYAIEDIGVFEFLF